MALPVRAGSRSPAARMLRGLLGAATAETAVLAVTGVYLVFYYRPSPRQAWGVPAFANPPGLHAMEIVRTVHRATSTLLLLTLLVAAALLVVAAVQRAQRAHAAVAAVALAITAAVTSFTGFLLPWDQLALRAVTVGGSMMGFRPILDHSALIEYVLIAHSAVSVGTMRAWLVTHVVVLPAAMIGIGVFVARRIRRHDQPDGHTRLGT